MSEKADVVVQHLSERAERPLKVTVEKGKTGGFSYSVEYRGETIDDVLATVEQAFTEIRERVEIWESAE